MNKTSVILKDLVLVGGGHSHVAVLKRFGMRPLNGLRITLITRDLHTPYSGMLPGFIAGHYHYDECHIDLRRLARFAGARVYHSEVTGLDLEAQEVQCANRPPVHFDILSINIGSRPHTLDIRGAREWTLPVKPIDRFIDGWETLVARVLRADEPFRIAVVGGGAGGVELALATQHRLRAERKRVHKGLEILEYHLLTDTECILPTHNPRVRGKFERVLSEREIAIHTRHAVRAVTAQGLECANGKVLLADAILWVTNAAAQPWLREAGLDTDEAGFVRVNRNLQSLSHEQVFAVGDIASVVKHPRPKSGVFAVRQGPPLAENLRRAARSQSLRPFRPQTQFLSLISTGDQYAVASRAFWSLEGAWVWRVKDWIDRRFMAKYQDLPIMDDEVVEVD
ncbi:MAG: FAD-dependent oxidoreductase, partial [Gammaproteobacteria bacterium]|nr:FAD-dependent oxidoreductase [Gammaproteobacteria bacterium]